MSAKYPINKELAENLSKLIDDYANELVSDCETGADALRIARALEHESFHLFKSTVLRACISAVAIGIVQSKINKRSFR